MYNIENSIAVVCSVLDLYFIYLFNGMYVLLYMYNIYQPLIMLSVVQHVNILRVYSYLPPFSNVCRILSVCISFYKLPFFVRTV